MKNENLNILNQIYNTLKLISTKGDDTIYMGHCLSALGEIIQDELKDSENKKEDS